MDEQHDDGADDLGPRGGTTVGSEAYEALPERKPDPVKRKYMKNSPQRRRMEAAVPGGMSLSSHQFSELLSVLNANAAAGNTSPALEAAVQAIQGLKSEVERTVTRSNATHPGISAFSYPEGDVAARKAGKIKALRYETYFCGGKQSEDDLTPTEVDLYNKFERSVSCRDGRWTATIRKDGTKTQLHIWVPCKTNDDLASLPSLVAVLGELLYGAETVDPTTMMTHVIAMEREIAELKARQAQMVAR
jgi:hypothetical protein